MSRMTSFASLSSTHHQEQQVLTGFRKGVADQQLAKVEEDRKRSAEVDGSPYASKKRSMSVSEYSSTSVSTISTNMSRSPSPKQSAGHGAPRARGTPNGTKRVDTSRSRGRSASYTSDSSYDADRHRASRGRNHDPRARRSVHRLEGSGRGRLDDRRRMGPNESLNRKRRRSRSSSVSFASDSTKSGSRRYRSANDIRNTRPRRSTVSPDMRGRDRRSRAPRSSRKTRSRSSSMDRSRIARERLSMTPDRAQGPDGVGIFSDRPGVESERVGRPDGDGWYGSSFRNKAHGDQRPPRPIPVSPPRKERSLSPFSKRLALTQAMNQGR